MDSSGIYRYEIDETDRICDVDDQWLAFAVQNGAGELTRDAVVGQSVHRYMAGWSVCELYATLFGKLRQRRSSATFPFRCDSPDLKRYMQMEISPGTNGHLMLAGRMLHSIARPRIPLLDPKTRHNGEWQIICSLCRRILLADGTWREAEEALPAPYAEPAEGLPQLSHDICPACIALMQGAMGDS